MLHSVDRIATALRAGLRAFGRQKQVIRRNGDVADEPVRPEVDRNRPVERSSDALEDHLTEALALRLPDRRTTTLLRVQPDALVTPIARPAKRDRPCRARQRTVLG